MNEVPWNSHESKARFRCSPMRRMISKRLKNDHADNLERSQTETRETDANLVPGHQSYGMASLDQVWPAGR